MSRTPRTSAIPLLAKLFREGTATSLSDAELASRFAKTRDPETFSVLVNRHGPMVMAVCRGRLGPQGDGDDAFQATFLILLNRLGTFAVGQSLGGWLYRVARRVSRQARLSETRRRKRESAAPPRLRGSADRDPERAEILEWVRREVNLLPERYRAPIVLCDLQGLTRSEAAELLGCPEGTIGVRIARGRRRLRERLERQGVGPAFAFPLPTDPALTAAAWRSSLDAAIRAAALLGAGKPATPAAIALAARSTALLGTVPLKAAVALMAAACFTAGLIAAGLEQEPPKVSPKPSTVPTELPNKPSAIPNPDDPKLAGHYEGKVIGPDGQPLAGANVFVAPNNADVATAGPLRATSGADGRFTFDAPDMTFNSLDGLPARRQGRLIAIAEGYAPDSVVTWGETGSSFRSHMDPVRGADLTLKLVRDDVPIQGRILDPEGKPLAGAVVRVIGLEAPSHQTFDAYLEMYKRSKDQLWMFDFRSIHVAPEAAKPVLTDAEGRFQIKGLGNDRIATLNVTAHGMVDMPLSVMTRDTADVVLYRDPGGYPERANWGAKFTIKLKAGRTVSGVVRDRQTHEPIAGMWVGHHVLYSLKHGNRAQPVVTDAQGRFTVSGIHPAINPLEIEAVSQPGMTYLMARWIVDDQPALIECAKGIPFRIKLVDEAGKPVDSGVEVTYQPILPNPNLEPLLRGASYYGGHALSVGANRGGGVYEGFVIPGPGAVLVKWARAHSYRPAFVDPKAFFEPGRTDWTPQEQITSYGTQDTLIEAYGWSDQHDYAAIVLVNPAGDSKPLEPSATLKDIVKRTSEIVPSDSKLMELSATLFEDTPRMVTLLDPEGKPAVGVDTQGLTYHPWDAEPRLRASTFPLTKLHPDRVRRIKFLKEDRMWIGFLLAKGDAETPYTVQLQRWASITGRILDKNSRPIFSMGPQGKEAATLGVRLRLKVEGAENPVFDECQNLKTDGEGRFRVEGLIPGIPYNVMIYRLRTTGNNIGLEFRTFQAGEVRVLGDIHLQDPDPVN